jgi:hypothetical protein
MSEISFLVCEWTEETDADFLSMFDDNVTGACCMCGHSVTHRPAPVPMNLTPICRRCFMAKPHPNGLEIAITPQQVRELRQFARLNRTRQ